MIQLRMRVFAALIAYGTIMPLAAQSATTCSYSIPQASQQLITCLEGISLAKGEVTEQLAACLETEPIETPTVSPQVAQIINNIPVHEKNLKTALATFNTIQQGLDSSLSTGVVLIQNKQAVLQQIASGLGAATPTNLFPLLVSPGVHVAVDYSTVSGTQWAYIAPGMSGSASYGSSTIPTSEIPAISLQSNVTIAPQQGEIPLANIGFNLSALIGYYKLFSSPLTLAVSSLNQRANVLLSRLKQANTLYQFIQTLNTASKNNTACIQDATNTLLTEAFAQSLTAPLCGPIAAAVQEFIHCSNQTSTYVNVLNNGIATLTTYDNQLSTIIGGGNNSVEMGIGSINYCAQNSTQSIKQQMDNLNNCVSSGSITCKLPLPWTSLNATTGSGQVNPLHPIAPYQPAVCTLNEIPNPNPVSSVINTALTACNNMIPPYPGNGNCTYTTTQNANKQSVITASCTAKPTDSTFLYGSAAGKATVADCQTYLNYMQTLGNNINTCTASSTSAINDYYTVKQNIGLLEYFTTNYFNALLAVQQCSENSCNNDQICMDACQQKQLLLASNFAGLQSVIYTLVNVLVKYYPGLTQGGQLAQYAGSTTIYSTTIDLLAVPGYTSAACVARTQASPGQTYMGQSVTPDANGYIYPAHIVALNFISQVQPLIDNPLKVQATIMGWYKDVYGMTQDQWLNYYKTLSGYHTGSSGCSQFFSSRAAQIATMVADQVLNQIEAVALSAVGLEGVELMAVSSLIGQIPSTQSFNETISDTIVRSYDNGATATKEAAQQFSSCMQQNWRNCGSQFGHVIGDALMTALGATKGAIQALISKQTWIQIGQSFKKAFEAGELTSTSTTYYAIGDPLALDANCKQTCSTTGWSWQESTTQISNPVNGIRQVTCTCTKEIS